MRFKDSLKLFDISFGIDKIPAIKERTDLFHTFVAVFEEVACD